MHSRIRISRYLLHIFLVVQIINFKLCIGNQYRFLGLIVFLDDLQLRLKLIIQKHTPYLRLCFIFRDRHNKIIYRGKVMRCRCLPHDVRSVRERDRAGIAFFISKHFCFPISGQDDRICGSKIIGTIRIYFQAAYKVR